MAVMSVGILVVGLACVFCIYCCIVKLVCAKTIDDIRVEQKTDLEKQGAPEKEISEEDDQPQNKNEEILERVKHQPAKEERQKKRKNSKRKSKSQKA